MREFQFGSQLPHTVVLTAVSVKPTGKGQYIIRLDPTILKIVAARLGRTKPLPNVSVPVPSDPIKRRPDLLGTSVAFKVIPGASGQAAAPNFAPNAVQVEVSVVGGPMWFRYGVGDLHVKSVKKWDELCA